MKYIGWPLLLAFLAVSGLIAQAPKATFLPQHQKDLEQIDRMVSFLETDYSAKYTIVTESPGEGRRVQVAALFRRDRENKYLILVLQPDADKGKGYLKIDNNLWYYDPVERRSNVTSAKDRFQNSSLRNSDFTRSNLAVEYGVTAVELERLGKLNCRVFSLSARIEGLTYPLRRLWIDEENLVRKIEDYSLSRQLLRTTAIPNYIQIGSKFIPAQTVIIDELKGKKVNGVLVKEKTQVTVTEPSLQRLTKVNFIQADLERYSQQP